MFRLKIVLRLRVSYVELQSVMVNAPLLCIYLRCVDCVVASICCSMSRSYSVFSSSCVTHKPCCQPPKSASPLSRISVTSSPTTGRSAWTPARSVSTSTLWRRMGR